MYWRVLQPLTVVLFAVLFVLGELAVFLQPRERDMNGQLAEI